MIISKDFIDSQTRNQSGFIAQVEANTKEEKQLHYEVVKFRTEVKNSGQKFNKDFYDQLDAIRNYAIINSQSLDDLKNNLSALKTEMEKGEYTQKPYTPKKSDTQQPAQTQQYVKPKATQAQAESQQTQGKKKKFEPLLNDKGFVINIKPKNENQELIAKQFDDFFTTNMQNKGFSRDFINSFNNSRNYHMYKESSQDKIDDYLKKTLSKIERGLGFEKKETNNANVNELLKEIKSLKDKIAILEGKNNQVQNDVDTNTNNGNILQPKVVRDRVEKERRSMIGKGYQKEDYAQLKSLNYNTYKNMEELEKSISDFRAEANERLKERQSQAPAESQTQSAEVKKEAQKLVEKQLTQTQIKNTIKEFIKSHTNQGYSKAFFDDIRKLGKDIKTTTASELAELLEKIVEQHDQLKSSHDREIEAIKEEAQDNEIEEYYNDNKYAFSPVKTDPNDNTDMEDIKSKYKDGARQGSFRQNSVRK